jgi:glycosyltransferase involved in cell wall biosynthesis
MRLGEWKLKIGIDATGMTGWRGPSRNIRNTVLYLTNINKNHDITIYSDTDITEYIGEGINAKIIILPYRKYISWYNITLPLRVIKDKIDVFVFPQANFWLWKPTKTIILFRSATIQPWKRNFIEYISAKAKAMRVKSIADSICAVSHFNAMQLNHTCGIEHEKVQIVSNGISAEYLDNNILANQDNKNYLLFIGGNEKRKNIHNALKAFKIINDKYHEYKLIILGGKYGDEPDDKYKMILANELNMKEKIIFHGIENDVKKIASFYKGAKAVIYPSYQETFGMVAVEAMACGCPVVASYMPAIPEVCGDAALYFNPYDPVDMADKVEKVINDENIRKDLIEKGYKQIKKYRWEESADKLLKIIEDVYHGKC